MLALGLSSCSAPPGGAPLSGSSRPSSKLTEVSPPVAIQELRKAMEIYQPQVKILSPRSDEVLKDTTVSVRLQVSDLPLFQDEERGLGPHLHFILDNQPYEAVYDTSQPIVLEDLTPGTHTLRVFASRPWHESFKNEGAYAQTTFHVFAKTPDNQPNSAQPLLTFSRPKGTYGAEPVMLDFYLTNAPLHLVARESSEDSILDWQVRCTVNGESFTFDRWEPIYLKGLKPGRNWVQLELLDEKGNPLPNAFNNTVRLITYEPGGTDTLSQLVRGELTAAEVFKIVDQNYVPPPPPAPEPEPTPEPELSTEPEAPETPALEAPAAVEPAPETTPEPEAIEPPSLSLPETEAPAVESPEPEEMPAEFLAPSVGTPEATPQPESIELTPESELAPAETSVVQERAEEELVDAVEEQIKELESTVDDLQSQIKERLPSLNQLIEQPIEPLDQSPEVPKVAPAQPAPAEAEDNLADRAKSFFNRLMPSRSAPKASPAPVQPAPIQSTPIVPSPEPTVPPSFPREVVAPPPPTQAETPQVSDLPAVPETNPSAATFSEADAQPETSEAIEPPAIPGPRPAAPRRYYPPINLTLPPL